MLRDVSKVFWSLDHNYQEKYTYILIIDVNSLCCTLKNVVFAGVSVSLQCC